MYVVVYAVLERFRARVELSEPDELRVVELVLVG
jgi:hypothetical protein